jgi:hypothetical protein
MRVRLSLAILFVIAASANVHAQELDVYDVNDFVDPRALGAVTGPHGRLTCPCDSFLVSRLIAGGVSDYMDVFRPTDSDASFLHLATSYYRGPWQLNWKWTQLQQEDFFPHKASSVVVTPVPPGTNTTPLRRTPLNGNEVFHFGTSVLYSPTPNDRNTMQLARYFTVASSIIRMEATWTRTEYRDLVRTTNSAKTDIVSRYKNELGFEGDIPWRVGRFPLITSLTYEGRSTPADRSGAASRRVTLLQRVPRISFHRWSLDSAVAVGSVRGGGRLSNVVVQPSLHLVSPTIPFVDVRLNIRYAPAIGGLRPAPSRKNAQSETVNQLAVFIDRAVFAKRFH